MNPTLSRICALSALTVLIGVLQACKTSEPGVRSNYLHQYTTVAADPPQATAAAKAALRDLDLKKVSSKSTRLEGSARGYLADGSKVNVSIQPKGQNASSVTVNVGTFGYPDLGKKIVASIQQHVQRMNGMNGNRQGANPQGMNRGRRMNGQGVNNRSGMNRQDRNNANNPPFNNRNTNGMNDNGMNGNDRNDAGMNNNGVNDNGMYQ